MPQQRASSIYTPLKYGETRLLQQSMDADAIVWFLNTVWLHDRDVDALSYTWRDQSHTLSSVCNGQEPLIHRSLKDGIGGHECSYHVSRETAVTEQTHNTGEIVLFGKVLDTVDSVHPKYPEVSGESENLMLGIGI
ncbi:hypothetical protein F4824DRAFT_503620 [Ustulina deusta]|nr:hypothetical protein F4824DRAFT_503620 [Ustulina deusta]